MSNGRKVGGFVYVHQDGSFQRTTCFASLGSLKLNVLSIASVFMFRVYCTKQISNWFQQFNSSSNPQVPVCARLCPWHRKQRWRCHIETWVTQNSRIIQALVTTGANTRSSWGHHSRVGMSHQMMCLASYQIRNSKVGVGGKSGNACAHIIRSPLAGF